MSHLNCPEKKAAFKLINISGTILHYLETQGKIEILTLIRKKTCIIDGVDIDGVDIDGVDIEILLLTLSIN